MNYHQQKPPFSWDLILIFVIISIIISVLGTFFIRDQENHLLKEKENELATVANLKVGQIRQWRQEKVGDANLIHDNLSLAAQVYNYFSNTDGAEQKEELLKWMNSIIINYDYLSASLVDTKGKVRLSVPEPDTAIGPILRPLIPLALKSRRIILTDLHRVTSQGLVHMDLLIPMLKYEGKDSAIVGLIILRINPEKNLFPLIQSWPTPSKTSETLLIRRDEDSITYLNNVRQLPNSALTFRRPVGLKKLIGARAVLGFEGITEGVDYRNVQVVAVIKKVPDSPWFMVAKVDKEEIFSSFSEQLLIARLLIVFFIFAFGSVIGWIIWHQRVRYYREKYVTELDRQAVRKHFDYILKYANDIILLIDKDLTIVEANDRAVEVYKYNRDELIGMKIMNLRHPELSNQLYEQIAILNEFSFSRYETIHVCKDGSHLPVEISARLFEIEGVKYYQSIAHDITERKKIQDSLKVLLERYNLATDAAKLAVWEWDIVSNKLIWDERVYELFAVEKGELPPVYESWLEILYPDDIDYANSEIQKALKGEKEYDSEFRIIMPDCSIKHIKAFGHVVRNSEGEPLRMIGINFDITSQKTNEIMLREREFWLSESQRVGKIGSYILDIKSNTWTSSEVLDEIFGITKESPKTLDSWNMLIHPSQQEEMIDYFLTHVIEGRHPFDKEYRILKSNSFEEAWVWGRGELSYDKEGRPEKMLGTIQDITERKISEILIIESEEKFRKIFEESPFAIAMTEINFNIIRVNAAFVKMLGQEVNEIINTTFQDFTHPDHIKADELSLFELIEGKIPIYKTEKRYIRKDNSIIWGSTTVSAIKDRNGIVQYFLAMIEDVTKRKETEILIAKSNSLLLAALESTADGILVVDLNGKIVQFNNKFTEMWGIPENVLISRDDEKALIFVRDQLKDPDSFLNNVTHLYKNPEAFSFDLLEFRDGRVFERYSQPQRINNEIVGRVWSFRDITLRKTAEDQLISAKEKAVESDRLKTAFLQNISHEIRTPMNAIVGFTSLLDDLYLKPENMKQYIDIIYQSSNQLLSIITDIVDISNIETGQIKLTLNSININNIIRNLYDEYNLRTKHLGLQLNFVVALEDDEAFIVTDGTKLIQILSNLLNNSLKFTNKGKIEIGYKVKTDFIEFVVRDTGVGIPKDKQVKIFDRFYQVENSTSRLYGGTGLGLSICKAYSELLGGHIRVESESGKGSAFYVVLPFKTSVKRNEKRYDPGEKNKRSFKGKTILIAEDDDVNFMLINKHLEENNLNLIRAVNGKEAVEICRINDKVDLVLLDLKMPGMDGLEAMKVIKQFRPDLIFIALTAYAFESDRKNAIECGCSEYIIKPFTKKELLDVIRKYLIPRALL
jgi:PAS domain S-box-containing protein